MKEQNKRHIIINSLVWKLLERGGVQGVQFVISIILARLLVPEDYGLIALISIFILISNVFIQRGFNAALIQKKEADHLDFSSVFYLSLFVAVLLYLLLFFTAPLIARFYDAPQLIPILRVFAITLIVGAVNSIQNAYLAREMQFRKLFFSSLSGVIVAGAIGLWMAYTGYGVWALVAQQLINAIIITLVLWFTVKWRPKREFSWTRLKGLFSYGWKLLVATLIDTLYVNIYGLIIGKLYSKAVLGYYNRGQQFPNLIVSNINGSIQAVMLPALSSEQEDRERVKNMVRRSIVTSSYVIFPMMIGLAAVAEPLVRIMLTDKWLPSVPYLQIFCISYALWPIHTANLQAINALGRSDIFLKLEVIKKIIGVAILAATVPFGVYAMAWGVFGSNVISAVINAYPNRKLLNYKIKEQVKDLLPSLLLSLSMGGAVYCLQLIGLTPWLTLIVQVVAGVAIYVLLSKLFKVESLTYLIDTFRETLNRRKKKQGTGV